MFVGEGPGHDEDVQGRPFVGRAGQLLTKIIQAMTYRPGRGLHHEHRQMPSAQIIAFLTRTRSQACTPYLLEQIRNIRPQVIVTLGKARRRFFRSRCSGGMTAIRGRFYDWNGIPVMPTFHPSYLIRNEGNKAIKKMVWDDMQKVMALLGKK